MQHAQQFFIDGKWVDPVSTTTLPVINPATEAPIAAIALGGAEDVHLAVAAARSAFKTWSRSNIADRLALLDRVIEVYRSRSAEIGRMISQEVGAPLALATTAHVDFGAGHFAAARAALATYEFERAIGTSLVVREPIGVCALITPWNWPINQIVAKVAAALAVGCTMVLKPSEVAPLNALLFAEVLDEAGVPAGVFNLVNGDGPTVGKALSIHPEVDMVSFTGSTRAGIEVALNAAPTVKRVTQELGGKSANIVLDDADLTEVISRDVMLMCTNSGQSCNAPTRMLLPIERMDEAAAIAADVIKLIIPGDPQCKTSTMGPVASETQFDRIQTLVERGIAEGAILAAGGLGRPEGLSAGYFVRPTVFSHVSNEMAIAREEIFGPVLVMIGYKDQEEAIRIANDSPYGLSAYVSGSPDRAKGVARHFRSGQVHINGAPGRVDAPFGGYKQSGNGREFGEFGLEEFLETKALLGFSA